MTLKKQDMSTTRDNSNGSNDAKSNRERYSSLLMSATNDKIQMSLSTIFFYYLKIIINELTHFKKI